MEYNELLEEIKIHMNFLQNEEDVPIGFDLSDLGNSIGGLLADYILNNDLSIEEELGDFIAGVNHGFSVMDGTHDSGDIKEINKIILNLN